MTHARLSRRLGTLAVIVVAAALSVAADEETPAPTRGPAYQSVAVVQMAVSDLEASMAFYREVMGFELEEHIPALQWAKYRTAVPGLFVGLGQQKAVRGSGTVSLNLSVDDAEVARARLEAQGVLFEGETVHFPGVVMLADFKDPDGNLIRLAGPSK